MASSRDREAWSHIFKLYKGFPHLWDKNNINYGNRSMMTDGYKILTRVYREHLDKQASVGALRMKMKNLRTTYYRELRKIKQAKQKGEKYTPSLWYFENLNFLGTSRSNISNTTLEDDRNEDSSQTQDLIIMEETTPIDDLALENGDSEMELGSSTSHSKVMKRIEAEKKHDSVLLFETQDPFTDMSQKKTMKDEHWEVIGKSIGYQLKELSKKQYTIVSKLISDAIYFGRLNKLTEDSHIETFTSHYTPARNYVTSFHGVDVLANHDRNSTQQFKHEEDEDDEDS
ncbi:unnamed protein product [Arctia plantaginis]|uniref:MADF domain-containing protein n=1 Tax=Arctia plantaginis TaxID=874455 RepID=A0A8S0Z7I0_ARCPL|nr:unnamed protein product [Arctia plantaginis]